MSRKWASRDSLPKEDLLKAILRGALGAKVVGDEPLGQYTSFKVGGPAEWFFRADNANQLQEAVEVGRRAELPIRIIGGGSNVLVSDQGVKGFVILNKSKRFFVRPSRGGMRLVADSGVSMPYLAGMLAKRGIAGLEWFIGVPGTIGGGVVQNAGAWGGEIRDRLVSVQWLTYDNEVETVPADELDLSYRHSVVHDMPPDERPVVLRATFQLERDDPDAVRKRVRYYTMRRTTSQPRAASGGSTFKNPPGDYAGRLIDEAGLKGYQIGGATFSETHANFIVNTGDATAADIQALIELARERVREQFGIELELEIERIGIWDDESAGNDGAAAESENDSVERTGDDVEDDEDA